MQVELRNIGPINRAKIDLDGLAVLVGPNASGKTTLSTACYAILLSHRASEAAVDRTLRMVLLAPRRLESLTPRQLGEQFASVFREQLSKELERCYSPNLSMLPRRGRAGNGSAPRIIVSDAPPGDRKWKLIFRIREGQLALEPKYSGYSLPSYQTLLDQISSEGPAPVYRSLTAARRPRGPSPVYFPAARSGYVQMQSVVSALLISALGRGDFQQLSVGKISGVAADFLQFLASMNPSRDSSLPQHVADSLEQDLLHGNVKLTAASDAAKVIEFAPEGLNESWPMDSAATSVAEIAPLLLYLRHRARRQDLLFIDEPEAHLHPANQIVLADVLLELSSYISGMVVGTHSEFFVTGISNGLLRRTDRVSSRTPVSLYELSPAQATGGYESVRMPVDSQAGFNVDQFSSVAEAALDEAEALFGRVQETR